MTAFRTEQAEVAPNTVNDLTDAQYWSRVWDAGTPAQTRQSWVRSFARRRFARHLRHLFDELLEVAGCSTGDLLEIGCGSGAALDRIHQARPELRLHGVDYSASGLVSAKQRLDEAGIQATLHLGDVLKDDLPQRYDVVISGGVIEHFADPLPIVRRHAELCKPGGAVIVTVPHVRSPVYFALLRRFDPETLAVHNLDTLRVERLQELFAAAGLESITVGSGGPPLLYAGASPKKRFGEFYRRAAWLWNAAVAILPWPPLWHSYLWAVGRVPDNRKGA